MERRRPADGADDQPGGLLRGASHTAACGHVHLPHARARLPAAVLGPVRRANRDGIGRGLRSHRRPRDRVRTAGRFRGIESARGSRVHCVERIENAALGVVHRPNAPASFHQHHAG